MGLFDDSQEHEGQLEESNFPEGLYDKPGSYRLSVAKLSVKIIDGKVAYLAVFDVLESDNSDLQPGDQTSTMFMKVSKKWAELFYQQLYKFLGALMDVDPNEIKEEHIWKSIGAFDEEGNVLDVDLNDDEETEYPDQPFNGTELRAKVVHRAKMDTSRKPIPGTEPGTGNEKKVVTFKAA